MAVPRYILMGPPGSGKSSVGRALAASTGLDWRDTDEDVSAGAGKSIADIFLADGEDAFRDLEEAAVADAVATHAGVLSLGGGAILRPATQALLEQAAGAGAAIVFLDVSLKAASPRVGLNKSRPLLLGNPRQQWLTLMEARRPVYERLATQTVVTDDLTPTQVAAVIEQGAQA
ncbi:shikimate kinase [Demequina litorisediminis]|uniref:Shikimate kinase n=1 Tax=Demequina litorisediminis TaxID=1849022 RepID=A0ABQ6I9W9_9MICO|nr:shikimate kinase [Demequina litorisediminis]GMA33802.1 shikimate kinase [Demequina litorisediminis]GMA37699.1 shikimate kinase [Demequina litorisediminis]